MGAVGVSAQLVGKLQAEAQKARGEECGQLYPFHQYFPRKGCHELIHTKLEE